MTTLFALAIVNLVHTGPEPGPATQLTRGWGLLAVCEVVVLKAGATTEYS